MDELEVTAELYRRWAQLEAAGSSPVYERLALAVAQAGDVLELLAQVPEDRRQPNLLFGALRFHGAQVQDPAAALGWMREHWALVRSTVLARRTQTNEPARCATLLPALALLPEPLALVEIGASAGLCLLYDAWRYHYTGDGVDRWVGPPESPLTLTCEVSGPVPLPERVPAISWRAGLDLNPIDPGDPDAQRWLQALVWPEHHERSRHLRLALAAAAGAPPRVERGDLLEDLADLVAQAPPGSTVVVLHSATLAYLDTSEREAFLTIVQDLGVHRVGAEGPRVLPHLAALPTERDIGGRFVISLDEQALALAHPHGRNLSWL